MRYAMLVLLVGCSSPPEPSIREVRTTIDLHPTVVIDSSFSEYERFQIETGLHLWERAIPEIHFEISNDVTLRYDAFVIFNKEHCPNQMDSISVGLTNSNGYRADICFDDSLISKYGGNWLSVTLHETGHAFGLSHRSDVPSIMNPVYQNMRSFPTCDDQLDIVTEWSLDSRPCVLLESK